MSESATATEPVSGGRLVVETLKAAGVHCVYGIPGGQTLAILDAVYDDVQIDFVAMRHEMAAAHAADAHFRMTGKPGVTLLTTGPGVTHAISAIGGAYRDRSAVVVLTCNNRREYLAEEDAQAADHVGLVSSLTKWSTQVSHERALTRTLRTAFSIAAEGSPGPVHVDLPRDLLEARFSPDLAGTDAFRPPTTLPLLAPDTSALDTAATLLREAARPVFWVGNGVTLAGAGRDLVRLAEQLEAPMVTTYSGIGTVPSEHPLVFGPCTRHGTQLTHSLLQQADLVCALGMRLSSSSTHRWSTELPPVLIHNDADHAALGRHYSPNVALPGDAGLVVRALADRLTDVTGSPDRASWLSSLEKERDEWRRGLESLPAQDAHGRVHPATLMQQLTELTVRDTIFAVDAGNPGIWSHLLSINEPRSYMKPVNYGQMGFALPAGIAAKRVQPERPVVVIVGDGSFGMSVAELETAVRERLALTVVVVNDSSYNNIRQEQLTMHGAPRYIGVDFANVDYATVATGFGAWGRRAIGTEETRAAIGEALHQSERPAVIDVVIDDSPNVWTGPF